MIDVYSWPAPNPQKIHIMLEETKLPYRLIPTDILKGDQLKRGFLKVNPNNKLPAIVDRAGPGGRPITIFESAAILQYLADKTGKLLPKTQRARYEVLQWLAFQVGCVGPYLGQAHHFRRFAPRKIQYAIDRYTNEAGRLYRVVDKSLKGRKYIAGGYSIADVALYPWLNLHEMQGQDLGDYPNIKRWYERMSARPAVKRGMALLTDLPEDRPMTDREWQTMYGSIQFAKR